MMKWNVLLALVALGCGSKDKPKGTEAGSAAPSPAGSAAPAPAPIDAGSASRATAALFATDTFSTTLVPLLCWNAGHFEVGAPCAAVVPPGSDVIVERGRKQGSLRVTGPGGTRWPCVASGAKYEDATPDAPVPRDLAVWPAELASRVTQPELDRNTLYPPPTPRPANAPDHPDLVRVRAHLTAYDEIYKQLSSKEAPESDVNLIEKIELRPSKPGSATLWVVSMGERYDGENNLLSAAGSSLYADTGSGGLQLIQSWPKRALTARVALDLDGDGTNEVWLTQDHRGDDAAQRFYSLRDGKVVSLGELPCE